MYYPSPSFLPMSSISGGDAFQRAKERGTLSEEVVARYTRQVCEGLLHIHLQNHMHLALRVSIYLRLLGGVSQNLSSVTNDSFCYKLLKSLLLIGYKQIFHWFLSFVSEKRLCERGFCFSHSQQLFVKCDDHSLLSLDPCLVLLCLFVSVSLSLSLCLSLSLYIYIYICQSLCLCVSLSLFLSFSICLYVSLSLSLSLSLCLYISVSLSVYLSLSHTHSLCLSHRDCFICSPMILKFPPSLPLSLSVSLSLLLSLLYVSLSPFPLCVCISLPNFLFYSSCYLSCICLCVTTCISPFICSYISSFSFFLLHLIFFLPSPFFSTHLSSMSVCLIMFIILCYLCFLCFNNLYFKYIFGEHITIHGNIVNFWCKLYIPLMTSFSHCHCFSRNLFQPQPQSILFQTKRSDSVKIIDFGLAAKLDPDERVKIAYAEPDYASPEVLNGDQLGFSTDMWSIGLIVYML